MILHVTDEKYLEIFASIYNSANTLFQESERGIAAPDIFIPQFKNDENFVEVTEQGEAAAFMSYHCCGECFELTSLYVRREFQRSGLGGRLLQYFEEQVPSGGLAFVKVLNNAPWSEKFYRKNGYAALDDKTRKIAEAFGIAGKKWSTVLCRKTKS